VDLAQMLLSEAMAIFGYALLCTAVYKIFQLGKEVREIKDLLKKSSRNSSLGPVAPSPMASPIASTADDDAAAAEYAENLLRSLQAEAARGVSERQKTL
jgi:hypothetical protein